METIEQIVDWFFNQSSESNVVKTEESSKETMDYGSSGMVYTQAINPTWYASNSTSVNYISSHDPIDDEVPF